MTVLVKCLVDIYVISDDSEKHKDRLDINLTNLY